MSPAASDIATRADCERLVRAFYGSAFDDELLGPIFRDVAKLDLESHVPRFTSFWETVLLGARSYGGGAFVPHYELDQQVPLTRELFARWVQLWSETVDSLFAGPVAEDAKLRAMRVAAAFGQRLEQLRG
jgi:hemoglobin